MLYYLQISVSAFIFSKFGILISKSGIPVSNLGILFGTSSFECIAFMDNRNLCQEVYNMTEPVLKLPTDELFEVTVRNAEHGLLQKH